LILNGVKFITSSRSEAVRIVVVDDEPCLLDLYQNIFKSSGAEVLTFQGQAPAVEYLGTGQKVDVVVTDWDMPGGSGCAVVEEAKSREIFTILCSGSAQLGTAFQASRHRPDIVLQKPFNPFELREMVKDSLPN
jgi:DNA-binding NtrC family response regulator